MENNNEVVIIGGNHHNTLSVIRLFGIKKTNFKILIHEDNKYLNELMISHSKYAKYISLVKNDENEIINWLLDNKKTNKQVIIPCSDFAEYTIDNNYDKIKDYYFIPGFENKPGKVVSLMDKYEQKKWADKNDIPMAKSWLVTRKEKYSIPKGISYPCIIKPNISAYGNKNDIKICNNEFELNEILKKYIEKKYANIIIQQFLKKKYEICALGVIINSNKKNYGGIIKKDRENPPYGGGSLTFAHFIDCDFITKSVQKVIDTLYNEKYFGLYDIEFLVCEDKIYLNEINFRNSGNNYALLKNGIEAPYIYYLYSKGVAVKYDNYCKIKNKNMYFMDEFNELVLLKHNYISLKTFLKDIFKTSSYAKLNICDLNIMIYYIKKILKKKRNKMS